MKNILLSSLLSIACFAAYAQPVVNYNSNHGIGTKSLTYMVSGSTTPFQASGAGITWDLSANTLQAAGSIELVDPQTTPYAASYPSANLAYKQDISGQGITYNFIVDSQSNMSSLADKVGSSGAVNWEPSQLDKLLEYPFSYSNSFNFTRKAYGANAETYSRTYDAYGTLKINGKTYSNVIRITKNPGNSLWFTTAPVFFPIVIQVNPSTYLYNEPYAFTGIKNLSSERLGAYPNPVSDKLFISGFEEMNGDCKLTIINLKGEVVSSHASQGIQNNEIDVSGIESGYYIFRVEQQERVLSGSFIKL